MEVLFVKKSYGVYLVIILLFLVMIFLEVDGSNNDLQQIFDGEQPQVEIEIEYLESDETLLANTLTESTISNTVEKGSTLKPATSSSQNTPTLTELVNEAEKNAQGQSLNNQLKELQKQLNNAGSSIRATRDTNKYSYSEEAVWQYCMNRWEYYDQIEGGYAGDKYTKQVFRDAGNQFGITASEAERIWNKVDRSKYGLD